MAVLSAGTAYAASEACCDSAESLLQAIDKNGGQSIVHGLGYDEVDKILSHIETGDPKWLAVAGKLAPYADAGFGEGLGIALATALPVAPQEVLTLAGKEPPLSLSIICGLPFIEPDTEFLKNYISKTRKALEATTTPDLQQKKAECLKQINTPPIASDN